MDTHTPAPPTPTRLAHGMRVALVTETYPPEVNGVAHSVARVVEGLRSRGHTVQLVRPRQVDADQHPPKDGSGALLTRGMAIPRYPHLRMGLPSHGLLRSAWRAHRPDIVHIATEGPLGWSALRVAHQMGLPVCSDFRTNFQAYSHFYGIGWLNRPILAYLRSFHNDCHSTMVPTDALRTQLARAGFRGLSVVARGVDTQRFHPGRRDRALRERWGAGDTDMVALYVGRLAPEKNLTVLIDAFQRLVQAHPRTRLVVVGDGPSRPLLEANCPQAVFAGFRSGDDLAAHYASSDVFLFPSVTETYGNVTPEAMASGLAVVAFDDAAAGQLIVHGSSGLLVPKGQPDAFGAAALQAAGDPALRQRLGLRARERVERQGWDAVVRRVEDTYSLSTARACDLRAELGFSRASQP